MSAQSLLSLCVPTHTCADKMVKDAHKNVSNGTATEKEKTLVKNCKKGGESRGFNEGYVVLDEHDLVERNVRLITGQFGTFNISVHHRNCYIHAGTMELQIGSIHMCNKGRKFKVLRKLSKVA